jgi:peroxiredoxin
MDKRQFLGIVAVIAFAAIASWVWRDATLQAAPDASFKTINGETIRLAKLKGRPVIITFWATDCPSCLEEIPDLITLHNSYSASGLTVIAVAMPYDPPNRVVEMATSKRLPYDVALDPDGDLTQLFGNVHLTPTTFLVNRSGNIVMQKVGVFDLADMRRKLERI